MSVLVTIDGVSGTFKSRISKDVAEYFGWQALDCGMIYRAITCYGYSIYKDSLLAHSCEIIKQIEQINISNLDIEINKNQYNVSDLRNDEISILTSHFAQDIIVQNYIHNTIREVVKDGNYIVEGREMSTIFPDAKIHYYFQVSLEAIVSCYMEKNYISLNKEEFQKMCDRRRIIDEIDTNRKNTPLRIPDNAIIVDVGKFGFNYLQLFNYIIETITKQITIPK